MRKLPHLHLDDDRPRRNPRRRAALAILVGLILIPLVSEGSAYCVARWQSMYGQIATPETPLFDMMKQRVETFSRAVGVTMSRAFNNVPWKPSLVIPLAFVWALAGCLLLRRR